MPTTLLTDNSSDQEEREPLPDKQFSKDFKNNNNNCKEEKNISTRTCKRFSNFPLIYSPKQHFETLHHHHHPPDKDANTSTAQSRSTNDTLKEEMHHNKEITNNSTPSSHLETAKKRRLDDTEETYESNSISSSSITPVSKKVNIDQELSSNNELENNTIVQAQNETKCVNSIAPNHHNCLPNSQQPTNHNICNDLAAAASCSNNNNVEEDTSSRIIVPTTSPPNLKTAVSSTSLKNSSPSSSKPKSVRFADERLTRSEVLHLIDEEKKRESERQYQEEAQRIKKQYESIGYAPAPVIPASTVSSLPKSHHYTISRPTLKINSNLRVNQQLANSTNTATNTTDKIKDITVVNPKNNEKEEIKLDSDKLKNSNSSLKAISKKKPIVVETASTEPNDNNNDNSQDQSKHSNLKQKTKSEEEKEQEDVFSDEDSDYDPFSTTTEENQENNPISTNSQGSQLQKQQQQSSSLSSSSSSLPTKKIDYFSSSVGVSKKEPKKDIINNNNNNKQKEDEEEDDDNDDFYGYSGNDHWNRIERMYELSKLRKEKIIEANMKLQQEIDNENDDALIKNTKE